MEINDNDLQKVTGGDQHFLHERQINMSLCNKCEKCLGFCPVGAFKIENGVVSADPVLCIECGYCIDECPEGAIR